MQILKCSESEKITIDEDGTVTVISTLPDFNPGPISSVVAFKISLPEILAMASKGCAVLAKQAQVPPDFIQNVIGTLEIEKKDESEKKD